MPIIEEVTDEGEAYEQDSRPLKEILSDLRPLLKIPASFQDPDWSVQTYAGSLIAWRNRTTLAIERLGRCLEKEDSATIQLELCAILELIIPFADTRDWVKPKAKELAQDILRRFKPISLQQVRALLLDVVKPAFERTQPNERLNLVTATIKAKPNLNAAPAWQDDSDCVWKRDPGLPDILSWCISSLDNRDWESVWPLLIPPVLTYLDDWEASHRLSGVVLGRRLITEAPAAILTRTGIDGLIRSSLEASLLRFGDTVSPALFKHAILTSLALIERTTNESSDERYQQLFDLLGERVIGGAWMYGYREPLLVQASYEVLPKILDHLGVACARYLKALIPQLLHTLVPQEMVAPLLPLQESSARALLCVVNLAAPRMTYWSGEIVAGVAKVWLQKEKADSDNLSYLLRQILQRLHAACPVAIETHLNVIKELEDPELNSFIQMTAS